MKLGLQPKSHNACACQITGAAFFRPRKHRGGGRGRGQARPGMEPPRSCHCSGQLSWGRVPQIPIPAFFPRSEAFVT